MDELLSFFQTTEIRDLHASFVMKQGRIMKKLKNRFLRLNALELNYYDPPSQKQWNDPHFWWKSVQPKGTILVEDIFYVERRDSTTFDSKENGKTEINTSPTTTTKVSKTESQSDPLCFSFHLRTRSGRSFICSTSSDQELDRWLTSFRKAIEMNQWYHVFLALRESSPIPKDLLSSQVRLANEIAIKEAAAASLQSKTQSLRNRTRSTPVMVMPTTVPSPSASPKNNTKFTQQKQQPATTVASLRPKRNKTVSMFDLEN